MGDGCSKAGGKHAGQTRRAGAVLGVLADFLYRWGVQLGFRDRAVLVDLLDRWGVEIGLCDRATIPLRFEAVCGSIGGERGPPALRAGALPGISLCVAALAAI